MNSNCLADAGKQTKSVGELYEERADILKRLLKLKGVVELILEQHAMQEERNSASDADKAMVTYVDESSSEEEMIVSETEEEMENAASEEEKEDASSEENEH